jgi:hypothetical protein
MLSPDAFFGRYHSDFPARTRNEARKLFRRAIRGYYVGRRRYVIDPESGKRVQRVLTGEAIEQQKSQRRKVKYFFTGRLTAGRHARPEIKVLIARLFIIWGRYAQEPATLSWKTGVGKKTNFEAFLFDLLPRLGAPDVRRYVEAHWRERK